MQTFSQNFWNPQPWPGYMLAARVCPRPTGGSPMPTGQSQTLQDKVPPAGAGGEIRSLYPEAGCGDPSGKEVLGGI